VHVVLPSASVLVYDADAPMTVTLLLFASYADALGASSLDMELPGDSTVGDVLSAVRAHPGAERLPPSPLVAVNQRYATLDSVVREGDEVALIPPVAGG
jgi:molybdopterin converting factor subunit 1